MEATESSIIENSNGRIYPNVEKTLALISNFPDNEEGIKSCNCLNKGIVAEVTYKGETTLLCEHCMKKLQNATGSISFANR